MTSLPTLAMIQRWDEADELRDFRDRFALPDGIIYLDGNSLGALPRATPARLAAAVEEEWGQQLIRGWNTAGWISAPQRVGAKIARLIGAKAEEVIVADSTSVNLFKLLAAGLAAQPGRSVVLSEQGNFPTDLYIAQGLAAMLPSVKLRTVPRARINDSIDEDVAVVMLTHVHYKTAERFEMDTITRAAHAQGALVLWDLSHSAGAVEVNLNAAGADLAIGCGYKYLNGGPGAPAFLYVAERHLTNLKSPLTGWMGHAAPFIFGDNYVAGAGIMRFLCGTPPILGLVALEAGVDLTLKVDMASLTYKSRRLSSLFIDLVEANCAGLGLTLITPRETDQRGSHVSFAHADGYPVMKALIARGVIGDFRAPDILRFGFTPLYTRYEDVWEAAATLHDILVHKSWDTDAFRSRSAVT